MRSLRALVLLASAGLAAGTLAPAPSLAAAPAPASLTAFSCVTSADPLERAIDVTAVMRPVPGTGRMQLRFQLMQRRPGRAVRSLSAPKLGSWLIPTPVTLGRNPADVWRLSHPVVNLPAPATYRLRVSFRWLGLTGQVLGTRTLLSAACHQPELRPDLVARSLAITPSSTHPGEDVYMAVIADRGVRGAGPFDVGLTFPGHALSHTVSWLGAHASRRIRFLAPACTPGDAVTVTADSGHVIDDYNRSNNALSVPCPAPASPARAATLERP
jgi:hypothetical protein